jgi:Zn-dependent protease
VFDPNMIFRIPALLIALTIHEYAHARAAVAMGDPTPRYYGRLTLNPIPHLDPIGLIMFWLFSFGWAKPVPINASNFNNWRKGMMIVSFAGPLSNMVVAFLTMLMVEVMGRFGYSPDYAVSLVFYEIIHLNLLLAVFNLIPIPPLDGSKVLMGLLPWRHVSVLERIEPYGTFILIALVSFNVIGAIVGPVYKGLGQLMYIIIYAVL